MEDKLWFSAPVKVWTKASRAKFVSHVKQAAEVMLNDWPEEWKEAASWRAAKKAALAAFEGEVKPDKVRDAFAEAAEEAHILDYQRK